MFCTNCGKELPDGAKFCSGCGTPTAPPAAPQAPEPSSDPIQIPGAGFPGDEPAVSEPPVSDASAPVEEPPAAAGPASAEETPAAESAPVSVPAAIPVSAPPAVDGGAQPAVKGRGKAGLVALGVGAAAVILVVVLLVKLLPGLGGGSGQAALAYLNDEGELMYLADLKEKTEALEITDEGVKSVQFSPDGKTVYFIDSDDTLYGIAAAELNKGGKPERISRNVSGHIVLKDGKVAYYQNDADETRLYIYEKGESYRLTRSQSTPSLDAYQFSEDQKTVSYIERDTSDNSLSLYRIAVAEDAEKERLITGASAIYTDHGSDVLVYGVKDSDSPGGRNALTVYSCTSGGDKTKLVEGVQSVTGVTADGGKASFYYYIWDLEEHTLYDFVTDDKAEEDAAILDEGQPVEPRWSYYSPVSCWVEDAEGHILCDYLTGESSETYTHYYNSAWVYYYEDGLGDSYPINFSQLDSGYYGLIDDLMFIFLANGGYLPGLDRDLAEEHYQAALEGYSARYDAWYEAQIREEIREELKNTPHNQGSFRLYHYTGGTEGDLVASDLKDGSMRTQLCYGESARDGDVLAYRKKDRQFSGKVADVADLDYAGQVTDLLSSDGGIKWYLNAGGRESELDFGDGTLVELWKMSDKEVVLRTIDVRDTTLSFAEDYETRLESYSIGADGAAFSHIVYEGLIYPFSHLAEGLDGKRSLYLFTEPENDQDYRVADLCVYRDGKLETIAEEVYGAYVLSESGSVYVYTDIDTAHRNWTEKELELAAVKNGELVTVSDEIGNTMIFLPGGQMLFRNADDDLYLWDGEETRRIARDVKSVWTSSKEDSDWYRIAEYQIGVGWSVK